MWLFGSHRQGSRNNDSQISTSLVDMYAKNGSLGESRYMFSKCRDGDVVLWNSLIARCSTISPDGAPFTLVLALGYILKDKSNGLRVENWLF